MKRVLIVGHRKMDTQVFDTSTPELRDKAFLAVFKMFDEEWEFYSDLEMGTLSDDEVNATQRKMRVLYRDAKNGHAASAEKLMRIRKQSAYEYEDDWKEVSVEE